MGPYMFYEAAEVVTSCDRQKQTKVEDKIF